MNYEEAHKLALEGKAICNPAVTYPYIRCNKNSIISYPFELSGWNITVKFGFLDEDWEIYEIDGYSLEEAVHMAKLGIAMTHPAMDGMGFTCDENGRITYTDGSQSGITKDVFKSNLTGWKVYKEPEKLEVETNTYYTNTGCFVTCVTRTTLFKAGNVRDAQVIAYMLTKGYITEHELIDANNNSDK